MAKQSSTAVAVVEPQSWALIEKGTEKIMRALGDIAGPSGFNPFELPRIKIPSSGGQFWELDGPEGPQAEKTFEAVILYHHDGRQFWDQPYGSGAQGPPACSSFDGLTGYGKPGGACQNCFQAMRGGKCAPYKALFLLLPHQVLPTLFQVPRMSLTNVRNYFMKSLAAVGDSPHDVLTRFGLTKRNMQEGGQAYSVATLERAGDVPEEMREIIEAYRAQFLAHVVQAYEQRKEAVDNFRNAPSDDSPSPWGGSAEGVPEAAAAPVTDDEDDDIPF